MCKHHSRNRNKIFFSRHPTGMSGEPSAPNSAPRSAACHPRALRLTPGGEKLYNNVYPAVGTPTGRYGGIGRHPGLKIPCWKQRTGSIPVTGTRSEQALQCLLRLFSCLAPHTQKAAHRSRAVRCFFINAQFSPPSGITPDSRTSALSSAFTRASSAVITRRAHSI